MKQFIFIPAIALFTLLNCSNNDAANTTAGITSTGPATTLLPAAGQGNNPYYSRTDTTKLNLPDSVWRAILPDSIYEVARHAETERPFTGKYWNFKGIGTYYCAACGNALFKSDAKFASSCGWPSFFKTIRKNSITYKNDYTYGMERIETLCGRCGGHLGHIFDDGPAPTYKRYCMNSIMLDFVPDKK
jgi:peptide-methionine (R)-S-oxide reductase